MTLVFLSNYLSIHQLPFSMAMNKKLGNSYVFIATEPFNQARITSGYKDLNSSYQFVLRTYENSTVYSKAKRLINNADIVIMGSAPESMVTQRIRRNKIVFRYSERPLKNKDIWYEYPLRWLKWHWKNRSKNIFMLSASAYTSVDYAKYGMFIDKCFKWGYFPEVKLYDDVDKLIKLKRHASILWVARLIEWKHPEVPLLVAKKLKSEGYSFELNLIGEGPLKKELKDKVMEYKIEDCVHFLGSMKPEEVRMHMEQSTIFLFTSDRNEGWGTVLNEAMNSGCAVVASNEIGSVPFMIKDGVNGYIYKDGNFEDLYYKVKELCVNKEIRQQMGLESYRTVTKMWNAENAANRLMLLVEDIQRQGYSSRFADGPCSKAEIIKDGWYR